MGKSGFRIIIALIILIALSMEVFAAFQSLTVNTCTAAGCTAAGWNDFDNAADGSSLTTTQTDALTMTDPSFDTRSAITNVIVGYHHGGNNPNIDGNAEVTFRNSAATITYCVSSTPNTNLWTYSTVTPTGCNWDYTKLTDLVIVVKHNGTQRTLYNSFMNFTINYTPYSDNLAPNITLGQPNNDSWKTTNTFSFFFTPYDDNNLTNCSLIINNTRNATKYGSENLTRGIENSINGTLSDGIYSWTINCTDDYNNTGTNATLKTIKVDTIPPTVNLEYPANNSPWTNQTVIFKFNSTDIMTTLSTCELIIDGSVRDSKASPAENTSLNFSYAPGNGLHNWSVNCTDNNGLKNSSQMFNISVNYAGPSINPDTTNYEQGQTVTLSGSNWNPSINLIINLTWFNGTKANWIATTTGAGTVSTTYFLNYSSPLGQYNISVYEELTPTNNATTQFNVIKRPVNAFTDYSTYKQGDIIKINGTGFSPNSTTRLIINWSGGGFSTGILADNSGYTNYTHNLSYITPLGVYNITIIDLNFTNLNATTNFSVEQRIATITTDKSSYNINEVMNITGLFFTRNGTVSITIFENSSGATAPSFPQTATSNSSGGFNYSWNVNNTCAGVYGITAIDINNPFLNKTVYFTINAASTGYSYVASSSHEGDGTASTLTNIQTYNDANIEGIGVDALSPNYLGINFTNTINPSATITYSRFFLSHYVDDITKVTYLRLDYLNESVWTTVTGCSIATHAANTIDYCDLNAFINNGSKANDIRLRVYYQKSTGNGNLARVDYANMTVTATGTATCTDWSNQPPVITYMLLEDSQDTPASQIDLNAGTTKNVSCNVTVYDYDGSYHVDFVNATLYHISNLSSSPDSNATHYTNNGCAQTGNNTFSRFFYCEFEVWYWAKNGTWFCNATTQSGNDVRSALTNSTVNPLYALNVNPLIDYGALGPMEASQTDVVEAVINLGNMRIDLGLEAFAVTPQDNISMNCSVKGNISLDSQRYSLIQSQAWSSMTPVTSTTTYLSSFDLNARNDSSTINRSVYWKLRPDIETEGKCNGTIVFTASAG